MAETSQKRWCTPLEDENSFIRLPDHRTSEGRLHTYIQNFKATTVTNIQKSIAKTKAPRQPRNMSLSTRRKRQRNTRRSGSTSPNPHTPANPASHLPVPASPITGLASPPVRSHFQPPSQGSPPNLPGPPFPNP